MGEDEVAAIAEQLAVAGIALTVLPSTDLFINGRGRDRLVPRGVAPAHVLAERGVVTSIATNNVMNPFTPFGDASLIRMANLYANVAQISRDGAVDTVFDMVSVSAASQMGAAHGLHVGGPATIVLLDAESPRDAVREVAPVLAGWKDGRQTFENGRTRLFRPSEKDMPT
jgi:cytosine/creatinine deaminase